MNININNGINVSITKIPKKNKTNTSKYCIYIGFTTYQNGIKQDLYEMSLGITVGVNDWDKGQATGTKYKADIINDRIDEHLNSAKNLLTQLSIKKVKTCSELMVEIRQNAKQAITGKAPRGFKNDFISKLRDYTYEAIVKRYCEEKKLSKARRRNYIDTIKLFKEYFNGNEPTLDLLTTEDLEKLNRLILLKYNNQNTAATFTGMVAAIINYAVKLKILTVNPLPEKFRVSFKRGERQILSEEDCLKLIRLLDSSLTETEQVAKYALLVQLLTGMGYGDLKSMAHDNIRFDSSSGQTFIEKERNKTGIKFIVNLTDGALQYVTKLKELTGTKDTPFKLPSIEYTSRMYKILGRKAKIKTNISTYTLRHTFSVDFMEKGGRIEDLRVRLGHTNIKTTEIYGQISAKRNASATTHLQNSSKMHQIQQPILKAV